jgi:hypothetical protein
MELTVLWDVATCNVVGNYGTNILEEISLFIFMVKPEDCNFNNETCFLAVLSSVLVPRRRHAVIPAVANSAVPTVEMATKPEYSFAWIPHYSRGHFAFYNFVCQRTPGQFIYYRVSVFVFHLNANIPRCLWVPEPDL